MCNHSLGQRQVSSHEKCRPVDTMEANDLLADHVNIRRPIMLKFFLVRLILGPKAYGSAVVAQSVKPDVNHVLGITRDRNPPLKRAAADGKIAQTALHKCDDFIPPGLRPYEVRMVLVLLQQLLCKCR